jgi:SPX domain protein involved in polyphosphate accumulation
MLHSADHKELPEPHICKELTMVEEPNYQDRIERNYQVAVGQNEVAALWRDLTEVLPQFGLKPIYEITCVGSVYFDNRDLDLTRYTILNGGRHILVRIRTYEKYGESPAPISYYWIEVKIRQKERWRKKRFKIDRFHLPQFLAGEDCLQSVLAYNTETGADPAVICDLYRETQETVLTTGIKPMLLLTYRRVAFQGETQRICLDWDIQYYHVGTNAYAYDSWKYPVEEPTGKSAKAILEIKHPQGRPPDWIPDLEKRYPISRTNFSKYVEGMGFLFHGPLKHHKEAEYFTPRIDNYMANSERL